jgi:hypothetical protein
VVGNTAPSARTGVKSVALAEQTPTGIDNSIMTLGRRD